MRSQEESLTWSYGRRILGLAVAMIMALIYHEYDQEKEIAANDTKLQIQAQQIIDLKDTLKKNVDQLQAIQNLANDIRTTLVNKQDRK